MKKVLCMLFAMVLVLSIVGKNQHVNANETGIKVDYMWETIYDDVSTMAADADLIVKGTITDQEYIEEGVTVYSSNTLEVSAVFKGEGAESIRIMQTGGAISRGEVIAPNGIALLEKNKEYVLFLIKATGDDYYYIGGANQGLFCSTQVIESQNLPQVMENCLDEFISKDKVVHQDKQMRVLLTPNYGWKWNRSTIHFCINNSKNFSPTESQRNNIRKGAKVWIGFSTVSDAVEVHSSADAEVQIFFSPEQVGITGKTVTAYSGSIIESSTVTLYYNTLGSYDVTRWLSCATHEFGHVYGLDHYQGRDTSVMYPNIDDCSLTPQVPDTRGMEVLYGIG